MKRNNHYSKESRGVNRGWKKRKQQSVSNLRMGLGKFFQTYEKVMLQRRRNGFLCFSLGVSYAPLPEEMLGNFFEGRVDVFGEQFPDGSYTKVVRELTNDDLQNHLHGNNTYGIYFVKPNVSTTHFTVIDIDINDVNLVAKTIDVMNKLGISREQILVEFSGKKGYHIWIKYEKAVEASKAKKFGEWIIQLSGLSDKTEIFPKQSIVKMGEYGNLIKLPLGIHRVSKNRSYFVDDNFQEITDWQKLLEDYQYISESQLDTILGKRDNQAVKIQQDKNDSDIDVSRFPAHVLLKCQNGEKEGNRDNATFEFAVELRNMGYKKEDIILFLAQWDKDKNQPPLGENIIIEKVESAFKKDYSMGNLQPVSAKELLGISFNTENYLGLGVLDVCSKMMISGEPKVGKSFFILDMAICLASGQPFLNIPVNQKTKVLYVQSEISEKNLQKRFKQMSEGLAIDDNLHFLTLRDFDILNETDFGKLSKCLEKSRLEGHGYEVVLFDPLVMFHSADENSSSGMRGVLARFDRLIKEFGISLGLVHHFNKTSSANSNGSSVRMRGSSAIFGWGDTYLYLTKDENKCLRLTGDLRNAENFNEVYIRQMQNLRFELTGGSKTKKLCVKDIVRVIRDLGGKDVPQTQIITEAHRLYKVSDSTVRNALNDGLNITKEINYKSGKPNLWSLRNLQPQSATCGLDRSTDSQLNKRE